MPFLTKPSGESKVKPSGSEEGVEVEIKVNIKFNLSNSFAAGDKVDTPEEKLLDNAISKVWDGENVIYDQSLMDGDKEDLYGSDSDDGYSQDERDDASSSDDDDDATGRSVRTADVILDDREEASYAIMSIMSTPEETEVRLEEEIRSSEMDQAQDYLDSVMQKSKRAQDYLDSVMQKNKSRPDNEDNLEREDETLDHDVVDVDKQETNNNIVKTNEEPLLDEDDSSTSSPEYENQDYFITAIKSLPSLREPEEQEEEEVRQEPEEEEDDVDGTIAIVEDNPPPIEEEEEDEDPMNALRGEGHQFMPLDSSMWLEDLKHVLSLQGLFPSSTTTTRRKSSSSKHHGSNGTGNDMLAASDAMAKKIKGFVKPLLEPGYESKQFYMDDDVPVPSSCSDLSGYASLHDNEKYDIMVRTDGNGKKKSNKKHHRNNRHDHAYRSLRMASSMDSILSDRVVRQGEERVASFFKSTFGVDLYGDDDKIDREEYKEFVNTYFVDSKTSRKLLNYERVNKHRPPSSVNIPRTRKRTDGQGRTRKHSQQQQQQQQQTWNSSRDDVDSSDRGTRSSSSSRRKHHHQRRHHHHRRDYRRMEV